MLILIAESKTMGACDRPVDNNILTAGRPLLEDEADNIIASLRDMTADQLSTVTRLSPAMTRRLLEMIYEFPNKTLGAHAIEAFTGVVFKALSYTSLNDTAKQSACRDVRIISSLYGWLRPDDIIKSYRLDFNMPVAPGATTLSSYWRQAVTDSLLDTLHNNGDKEIIDMLPGDAAKCIDWKRVSAEARVWKVDFKEVQYGGTLKTPNSNRLKTLRGLLLRQILTDSIPDVDSLKKLESDHYVAAPSEDYSIPSSILFYTAG